MSKYDCMGGGIDFFVLTLFRVKAESLKESKTAQIVKYIENYVVYQTKLLVANTFPRILDRVNQCQIDAMARMPTTYVGRSIDVFNIDCLFPQRVNEWAVPLERAAEAIAAIQAWQKSSGIRLARTC